MNNVDALELYLKEKREGRPMEMRSRDVTRFKNLCEEAARILRLYWLGYAKAAGHGDSIQKGAPWLLASEMEIAKEYVFVIVEPAQHPNQQNDESLVEREDFDIRRGVSIRVPLTLFTDPLKTIDDTRLETLRRKRQAEEFRKRIEEERELRRVAEEYELYKRLHEKYKDHTRLVMRGL